MKSDTGCSSKKFISLRITLGDYCSRKRDAQSEFRVNIGDSSGFRKDRYVYEELVPVGYAESSPIAGVDVPSSCQYVVFRCRR